MPENHERVVQVPDRAVVIERENWENDRRRKVINLEITFDEYVAYYLGWYKSDGHYWIR